MGGYLAQITGVSSTLVPVTCSNLPNENREFRLSPSMQAGDTSILGFSSAQEISLSAIVTLQTSLVELQAKQHVANNAPLAAPGQASSSRPPPNRQQHGEIQTARRKVLEIFLRKDWYPKRNEVFGSRCGSRTRRDSCCRKLIRAANGSYPMGR